MLRRLSNAFFGKDDKEIIQWVRDHGGLQSEIPEKVTKLRKTVVRLNQMKKDASSP